MHLRERFGRLYAGVVYDAMRFDVEWPRPFVLAAGIKPAWKLQPGDVLFGPAFTCKGERVLDPKHIDDTVRIRMFRSLTPGCVQVIETGGDRSVAHFGDISGKIARKFGAVGAVLDGFTRDVALIEQDRFPVFCRGVQPVDAFSRWQIVSYEAPVVLDGLEGPVVVRPGDFLFGDPDGVLVLPRERAEEVCALAEERLTRENTVRRRIAETDDIQGLYDEIGRW
jgi:regulator of RNase E activity RraA